MSCRRCNRSTGQQQRGAALIIALLVFATCAALIVAMKSDFELFYQRAANSFLAEQGYAHLRGAEDLAALALVKDYDLDQTRERQRDDLTEVWAMSTPPFPLEDGGGFMRGLRADPASAGQFFFLEDLQGRFNLNNLYDSRANSDPEGKEGGAARFTPAQAQFIRLLQCFEEPVLSQQEAIAVTEALGDWLDSDSRPRLNGAEDEYYFTRVPAYRAANRRLASVSELRAVAHVTPALYRALAPWVTVWPREGGSALNINTAPELLLRTLNADDDLAPLTPQQAQAMVALRDDSGGFTSVAAFLEQGTYGDRSTSQLQMLLGERSSWFLLGAVVEVAGRSSHLYSVLHRSQRRVESRARSSGEL
ncbi:MAG: type II secretion system minor pseudopilin GspK [Parahaliea sp.]